VNLVPPWGVNFVTAFIRIKEESKKYNSGQICYCRDCKGIWTEGINGRVKHIREQKLMMINLYLENMGTIGVEGIEKSLILLSWVGLGNLVKL
jgi:hypothetical protein